VTSRQKGEAPAQSSERCAGRSPARERLRAVGYVRVSTQGQADHGMSLADQRDRIREYATEKGYELARIEQEAASGGLRSDEVHSWEHRPILLDVMDRAADGSFDVLIVAKLDRLSRDHVTLVTLERQLQRHGVRVESVAEEQNGDGPLAEFVRGQLALVAQLERGVILERVRAGKARKKALGRHVHGRIPYGYQSERGVLEPVPAVAEVVRRIFARAVAGDSPGRIARSLNREGTASPRGAAWTSKAVSRIVTNPVYAGERYGVKKAHPAIISRRTFNAANAELERRAAAWSAKRGQTE
jgi:site-specific DNA recombinase